MPRILEVKSPPSLLGRRQVAGLIGCSTKTVQRLERAGRLHPIHIGPRVVRYHPTEVAALIRNGGGVS